MRRGRPIQYRPRVERREQECAGHLKGEKGREGGGGGREGRGGGESDKSGNESDGRTIPSIHPCNE